LFVVVVFCSNLFGIDMNNLSLPEQSSGNGHVSISGMYLPWKFHDCTCNYSFLSLLQNTGRKNIYGK